MKERWGRWVGRERCGRWVGRGERDTGSGKEDVDQLFGEVV